MYTLHSASWEGSSKYILAKGEQGMGRLAESGPTRVHGGLESGSDAVLRRIRKGASREEQIKAGQMLRVSGIQNSTYVMLGTGGRELSREHARATASAVNAIQPDFARVRTFLPKVNTPLLEEIEKGEFQMVAPHEALQELKIILQSIEIQTRVISDHDTNSINVEGRLPADRSRLISLVDRALALDERSFRPVYIGTQ